MKFDMNICSIRKTFSKAPFPNFKILLTNHHNPMSFINTFEIISTKFNRCCFVICFICQHPGKKTQAQAAPPRCFAPRSRVSTHHRALKPSPNFLRSAGFFVSTGACRGVFYVSWTWGKKRKTTKQTQTLSNSFYR